MAIHQSQNNGARGLPDPDYLAEMYEDVLSKRFFAWIIDEILIFVIAIVLSLFTLFAALLVYGLISFLYRWGTLASRSATPGMRVMAIELRTAQGDYLTGSTAFFHTLGYFISVVTFPLQLISIVMMLMTRRRQGLTDAVLGTVALNRHVA
ncbi:RDD family protein [Rhodobacteraceae bacterium]|nr:RDD family protein [Paracoccaceae bacterium]